MNKKYPEEFKIEAVKQAIAWLMLPTVYERLPSLEVAPNFRTLL
ncbi:hypothetical protein H334_24760 [Vibrio parahaemolyticus 901128]|nr:hypothetical protein H334_24760 [Vibrio parahaemolyticus 901128]